MNLLKSVYKFLSPKYQTLFLEYRVNFKPRYGSGKPPHDLLYQIINTQRDEYRKYLETFLNYKDAFHSIKTSDKETSALEPKWNNGYLPGLDIVALYSFIRMLQPKQYIEIGSGNSTMVARKAIKDGALNTVITSIDPFPRASIDQLADKVIRMPLEDLPDYGFASSMEENDILFIDNSHRSLPNSDVTVCFLELIPRLKKGVVVHIHDIYLPYDYPQFMCDRFYSEQYLLATLLLAAPEKFKTMMPGYFVSEDAELRKIIEPVWDHPNIKNVERHGGSYWFKVM
jgi:predicted O-methyltransferase YrrM